MLSLFLFLSTFVWAEDLEKPLPKNFAFKCVSSLPTTSFLGSVKGNEFELTVIHHHGTPFMPIHRGIVVPNDFKYLQEKKDRLEKMGDRQQFRFPIEKCKLYGPTRFSCAGGDKQEFGGHTFEALYFHTSRIVEESLIYTFERTKAELSLLTPDLPVQEVPMEYYENECYFSSAKK